MSLDLSGQQRQAIRQQPQSPLRIVDSQTQSTYVLLSREAYERVRALFEEDTFHPDELAPLIDEVATKEGWAALDVGAPRSSDRSRE